MAKHYDYIAIGGGSGGIASINRAAMYGVKGLLIEGNELGGTCVNVGCVPKKVMWHASQISESLKLYANDYGFSFGDVEFDFSKLVGNRSAYIDRIHGSYERGLNNNKVDLVKGYAKFVNKNTVEVNGEQYTADHILIATGGQPTIPNVEGAEFGVTSNEV
ncbi:FAD-dependent oxidoreductase, partial [uncultured Gemella sp.]|uniref:FAD-dependent oxidoreductase n=1 Tax=uncultured Gemella sp. TaxID=254352 RepID=UPI00260AF414